MRTRILFSLLLVAFFVAGCSSPGELPELPEEPGQPGTSNAADNLAGQATVPEEAYTSYSRAIPGFITSGLLSAEKDLEITVQDNIVYQTGYVYISSIEEFKQFSLEGTNIQGTNWLSANTNHAEAIIGYDQDDEVISMYREGELVEWSTTLQDSDENYVVIYSCSLQGVSWDCHDEKWQIHAFDTKISAQCADDQCENNRQCYEEGDVIDNSMCIDGEFVSLPGDPGTPGETTDEDLFPNYIQEEPEQLKIVVGAEAPSTDIIFAIDTISSILEEYDSDLSVMPVGIAQLDEEVVDQVRNGAYFRDTHAIFVGSACTNQAIQRIYGPQIACDEVVGPGQAIASARYYPTGSLTMLEALDSDDLFKLNPGSFRDLGLEAGDEDFNSVCVREDGTVEQGPCFNPVHSEDCKFPASYVCTGKNVSLDGDTVTLAFEMENHRGSTMYVRSASNYYVYYDYGGANIPGNCEVTGPMELSSMERTQIVCTFENTNATPGDNYTIAASISYEVNNNGGAGEAGKITGVLPGDRPPASNSQQLTIELETGEDLYDQGFITQQRFDLLREGQVSTPEGSTTYRHWLRFRDGQGELEQNSDGPVMVFWKQQPAFVYNVNFLDGLTANTDGFIDDLHEKELVLMGLPHTIIYADYSEQNGLSLMLTPNEVSDVLRTQQERIYSINGFDYEVSVGSVGDGWVTIIVNGQEKNITDYTLAHEFEELSLVVQDTTPICSGPSNSTAQIRLFDSSGNTITDEQGIGAQEWILGGSNYEVDIITLSPDEAKFIINGEITNTMTYGENGGDIDTMSDGVSIELLDISMGTCQYEGEGAVEFSLGADILTYDEFASAQAQDVTINGYTSRGRIDYEVGNGQITINSLRYMPMLREDAQYFEGETLLEQIPAEALININVEKGPGSYVIIKAMN